MSVRQAILTLLGERAMHGYQLKTSFEERTGHVWPLNVGQVYTTLKSLQRSGLVAAEDGGDDDQHVYHLTAAGQEERAAWFATPVPRAAPPRDELAVKLMMAWQAEDVDLAAVVQGQRTATIRALQEYTRLKANAEPATDMLWLLVLDQLIHAAEAEVRWLDAAEARLSSGRPPDPPATHDDFLADLATRAVR